MNPLLRKYRRFRSLSDQQGTRLALQAAQASLVNSARYRWLLVRERALADTPWRAHSVAAEPDNDKYDLLGFLPAAGVRGSPTRPASVAVVIPVYRNLDATRACLASVLGSQCVSLSEVIVVDDASPEPELSAYLDELAATGEIRLLRSEVNRGFVHSVNAGMDAAGELDVVLLNSDTVVAEDWLDRLAAHAADATVGTVTPFSNNATICSYPTFDGLREAPAGETVAQLDAAFAAANAGRRVEIPTAVGFCMYISRRCLRDVGPFDTEVFKRGYGEENDFCLRASQRGWRHVLAADTFVWHEGEVSFGSAAAALQAAALEELRRRYPGYLRHVARHAQHDPARPSRVAATAARFRAGRRPVILMVTHALGGGTEKHVLGLCRHYRDDARFLILQPTPDGPVRLSSPEPLEALDVRWRVGDSLESLAALISSFGVDRIHVHHIFGLPLDVHDLLRRLGVPFDVTVHDFYSICPRVRLVRPGTGFCGGPEAGKCRDCLSRLPRGEVAEIGQWRARVGWMLSQAERVICPSRDTASHIAAFMNGPELVVALHDTLDHQNYSDPLPPTLGSGEPLRVGLVGVLSHDKGARLVGECARLARQSGAPVEFLLVGYVPDSDSRLVRGTGLRATGLYGPDELPSRLAASAPHVVWFPAVWPETYSYTLSEAMTARLPVLVPDLGAFSERVAGRPWSWNTRWDSSPADLVDQFGRIADELRRGEWSGSTNDSPGPAEEAEYRYPVAATADFYDADYLAPLARDRAGTPAEPRTRGPEPHA